MLDKKFDFAYFPSVLEGKPITDKLVSSTLKLLTQKELKHYYNCFYNIRFDCESIIKLLMQNKEDSLTMNHYRELIKYGTTFFSNYEFFLIHEKFFRINDNKYYDMFPFFRTRLDKAAKKYLGKGKKLDVEIQYDNPEWIRDNIEDVIEYFKVDCMRLAELAYFTCDNWEKMGFKFWNPISLGTISAYNFRKKTGLKKTHQLDKYYERIIQSYFGGMFDIWQRGTMGEGTVYTYDLNSCYPAVMTTLKTLDGCKIVELDEFDEKFDYSYYNCNAYFEMPFKATKIKGVNYYLTGWHLGIWLTKTEILMLESLKWKCEVNNGIGIFCRDKTRIFEKHIVETYKKRMTLDKDDIYKYLLKIYLNSLYGKFKQNMKIYRIFNKYKHNEKHLLEMDLQKYQDEGLPVDTHQFVNGFFGIVAEQLTRGAISNPVYATEITSIPRLQLLNAAYMNEDDIISFNTDAVVSTKPLTDLDIGENLGQWKEEITAKNGTFLNVGIYCYYDLPIWEQWLDDKSFYKESWRGAFGNEHDKLLEPVVGERLIDGLKTDEDTFQIHKFRFKKMRSSVKRWKPSLINMRLEETKTIDINQAIRRNWNSTFTSGYDMLERKIRSEPLDIEDIFLHNSYNYCRC